MTKEQQKINCRNNTNVKNETIKHKAKNRRIMVLLVCLYDSYYDNHLEYTYNGNGSAVA